MKCEFHEDGFLVLQPESGVEQFALSKWNRAKIRIASRDQFFSMIDGFKEIEKALALKRDQWERFLKWEAECSPNETGSQQS